MASEKNNVLEILDDVERKVEEFRAAALRLAEDKKELEKSVSFVESLMRDMPEMSEVDAEEVTANASRLRGRIDSVRCEVLVVRDDVQAEAADKMKQKMAELISAIETETEGATEKLQLYINCCSRDEGQARDCSFERLLLSCTSDDQKAVKSRLMQMKDFVDRTT